MDGMKTCKAVESSVLGEVRGTHKWLARILAEGAGSSAYYPESTLRADGSSAFPKGTQVHLNHVSEEILEQTGGVRSAESCIGALATDAEYLGAGDGVSVPGLYAEIEFRDPHAAMMESLKDVLGLSVNARYLTNGEVIEGKNVADKLPYLPTNTVDVVSLPGAKGKLLTALESYGIVETDEENHGEDEGMKPEDIEAIAKAVSEALVPALAEALNPPKLEEEGGEEATVDVKAVTEALITANLPDGARNKVYAAIEAGTSVEDAITAESEYIKSLKESFAAAQDAGGTFRGSSNKKDIDLSLGGLFR